MKYNNSWMISLLKMGASFSVFEFSLEPSQHPYPRCRKWEDAGVRACFWFVSGVLTVFGQFFYIIYFGELYFEDSGRFLYWSTAMYQVVPGQLMTRTRRRGIKLHSFKLIEAILVSHFNVTGFNDHEKQQYTGTFTLVGIVWSWF